MGNLFSNQKQYHNNSCKSTCLCEPCYQNKHRTFWEVVNCPDCILTKEEVPFTPLPSPLTPTSNSENSD